MIGQGVNLKHVGSQPWDSGCRFQLPGHRGSHRQTPMKKATDISPVMSCFPRHALNGLAGIPDEKSNINAHALHSVVAIQHCQGYVDTFSIVSLHNSDMPRWKYRDAFDADYLVLHKVKGMTHEAIAEGLRRSVHTVASYRRKGEGCVIPPEEVIRRFAAMTGESPFKYMDDPRVAEAVGLEAYAELPQWQKDLLQRNARAMDGAELTPKQWELLMDSLISQARALAATALVGVKK